jgi:flagellar motor protein MotB
MEQTGGGGTKINELMDHITNNQLNDKENTMVDSIINDLNSAPPPPQQGQPQQGQPQQGQPQGQPPPQQMNEQQMQQQMLQQQQQMEQYQQMMQQQQVMEEKTQQKKKKKEKEPDMIQEIITHIKLPLIVACLTLLINLDPITELFKGHSILFDVENNKFTIVTTIIKALLIGLLFFGINFAINK